ncbi:SPOR domain-containing protein [Marinomonas sp.]|nr:SPOR domain-containing protein [Marinomonas sp.]MDB4837110.1 SPOR domain-containing protein [Marinomonas sp.]
MKWLFFLIVLANAAFLGWHGFVQRDLPAEVESAYAPPVSEKVYLLSEATPSEQGELQAVTVISNENLEGVIGDAVEGMVADSVSLLCPRVEIERADDRLLVEQALVQSGWQYQLQEVAGKRAKYWLYIAAPETTEKARQIVKELTEKSVDSFVINRGEMKNRISLGLYSSEERAGLSKERIQKMFSYSVDIYEHMRNVTLQQVDIERSINEKEWEGFVSKFDLNEMTIKLEKNPC